MASNREEFVTFCTARLSLLLGYFSYASQIVNLSTTQLIQNYLDIALMEKIHVSEASDTQ